MSKLKISETETTTVAAHHEYRVVSGGHLERLESDSGWLKWRHACETEDQCGRYTKAELGNEQVERSQQ